MAPMTYHMVVAVAAAAAVFFALYGAGIYLRWRRLDPATRLRYDLDKGTRVSLPERISAWQATMSKTWSSELVIYVWAVGAGAGTIVGTALGVGLGATVAAAVAAGTVGVFAAMRMGATKRQSNFEKELLTGLNLMATQLEGGTGLQRSLTAVAAVVDEPLSSELTHAALRAQRANIPIVDSFSDMADRYPVPALKALVVALETEAATQGGKLAPMLRSLAEGLDGEFRLRSEATAEISQSKYEFYAIVGVFVVMWFGAVFGAGDIFRESVTQPIGIAISSVTIANALFGTWRASRLFAYASGRRAL